MPQEIERKFLVLDDRYKAGSTRSFKIAQGYISSHPKRSVRVRIREDQGFLTIKGETNAAGLSRFEWEKEIPVREAEELLKICEPGIIEKTRYEVVSGAHIVEVDEFTGTNRGLVVAEIELKHEEEPFERPGWLGKEVTGEVKYYNSRLASHPYSEW